MTGFEYIIAKQTGWARSKGIKLIGSKTDRGRPAYTSPYGKNLFQELLPDTKADFDSGDG